MRIFLHGVPVIALAAILAASVNQRIEFSAQAHTEGEVLPEVTAILLQSQTKSLREAGMRQQRAQLQSEQERQAENILNTF